MLEKFLAFILAIVLCTTSVSARDRNEHRHRDRNNSDAALIIGSIILGSIILADRRNDEYRRDDRESNRYGYRYRQPYARQTYTRCWQEPAIDYYGRPYYVTHCER